MKIARDLYEEMLAHAQAEAPNECCGMIASAEGLATKVYPAENTAASPLRYELDPKEQLKIELDIDDRGWDLGAIYHSHTRSEPVPSETDRNLAFHPDSLYIIIGLDGEEPDVRAWWIKDRGGVPQQGELVVE